MSSEIEYGDDYLDLPEDKWRDLMKTLNERFGGWEEHTTPNGFKYYTKNGMVRFSTMQSSNPLWEYKPDAE